MDTRENKSTYKKFNSFYGLRIKNKYNLKNFLKELKFILNDKNNLKNLNSYYIEILNYLKKDIFEFGNKNRPKFVLSEDA